jgi:hypothetical protein
MPPCQFPLVHELAESVNPLSGVKNSGGNQGNAHQPKEADIKPELATWLGGRGTGASSLAIVAHMSGGESSGEYPLDVADLSRCIWLLRIMPEWEPRIGEMARYSHQHYGNVWAEYARNWELLTYLVNSDFPSVANELVRELRRRAEKKQKQGD